MFTRPQVPRKGMCGGSIRKQGQAKEQDAGELQLRRSAVVSTRPKKLGAFVLKHFEAASVKDTIRSAGSQDDLGELPAPAHVLMKQTKRSKNHNENKEKKDKDAPENRPVNPMLPAGQIANAYGFRPPQRVYQREPCRMCRDLEADCPLCGGEFVSS